MNVFAYGDSDCVTQSDRLQTPQFEKITDMSSVETGNALEAAIFTLLLTEIEANRFWARKECCKIYQKKGYYSRDRDSDIIFDVSIEICLPGEKEYSLLVLIECKNYSHPVPVNDLEEFYEKLRQVTGANVKGVFATTNSLQSGAVRYASSKRLAVIRYFADSKFQWELKRSPSASTFSSESIKPASIALGLESETFQPQCFDLYCKSPNRLTNSLWEFVEDIAGDVLAPEDINEVENRTAIKASQVAFITRDCIENCTNSLLTAVEYSCGEVPLHRICAWESDKCDLKVIIENGPPSGSYLGALATISFSPLVIRIFKEAIGYPGRERFTLAHELGHHYLRHSAYMRGERCKLGDLDIYATSRIAVEDIKRLEWQANYFASCLLMPRAYVLRSFWRQLDQAGIHDKGFGALYVDNQRVNYDNFLTVTDALMKLYGVSRLALTNRLIELGLLNDIRRADTSFLFRQTKP